MDGSWLGRPPRGFGQIVPKSASVVISKPELRPLGGTLSAQHSVGALASTAFYPCWAGRGHG